MTGPDPHSPYGPSGYPPPQGDPGGAGWAPPSGYADRPADHRYPAGPGGYGPPPPRPDAYVPPPAVAGPAPRRVRCVLLPLLVLLAVGALSYAVFGARTGADPAPVMDGRGVDGGAVAPVTLPALNLQEGDCYSAPPLPADGSTIPIDSVAAVPCSQPHTAEVVAKLGYAGEDHTRVVETTAVQDCVREFGTRLGDRVRGDERYSPGLVFPDAASWMWTQSVACVVTTDAPVTGSAMS